MMFAKIGVLRGLNSSNAISKLAPQKKRAKRDGIVRSLNAKIAGDRHVVLPHGDDIASEPAAALPHHSTMCVDF